MAGIYESNSKTAAQIIGMEAHKRMPKGSTYASKRHLRRANAALNRALNKTKNKKVRH